MDKLNINLRYRGKSSDITPEEPYAELDWVFDFLSGGVKIYYKGRWTSGREFWSSIEQSPPIE